jgi:beta-N-acetylhexosaminidase
MNVQRKTDLISQIGQLLIVGFDGTEITPRLTSLLKRLQPAGVILFARNIKSAEQTWRLLRDCQKCVSTPLFTCVDLEGGSVDRFRDLLGPTPSAADVFATGDRKLYRNHGQVIGDNCRVLGFNVDFAPVLDLAFEASRTVLGSRVVSTNPRETITYARDFLAGLRSTSVLGCGKHFPGLGEGKLDSHHALPVIEKPLKKLWPEDLLPYRTLRAQMPMVMIAHAAYPQVTHDRTPASLSKVWITDILRRRIGYRNLIVSDDLEMGGVLAAAPIGEAAVEHIRMGGDMCLVCHREGHVAEAYEELVKTAETDSRFAKLAERAARRVLTF